MEAHITVNQKFRYYIKFTVGKISWIITEKNASWHDGQQARHTHTHECLKLLDNSYQHFFFFTYCISSTFLCYHFSMHVVEFHVV